MEIFLIMMPAATGIAAALRFRAMWCKNITIRPIIMHNQSIKLFLKKTN